MQHPSANSTGLLLFKCHHLKVPLHGTSSDTVTES